MGRILESLRAVRWWQGVVLVAVLVGAAVVTAGVFALRGSAGEGPLDEGQQLIAVAYGDVMNQVSTSGSLVFSNRVTLTFGSQGTVAAVLVEEGDKVEAGQELARLDESAQVSLRKMATLASVDLRQAEEALEKAQDPYTPLYLAQVEASVASAKTAVEKAQEALEKAQDPYTLLDLAQAEVSVTSARMSVKKAEEALTKAEDPYTPLDLAQAEVSVISARMSVKKAQETLDELLNPSADAVASAQSRVDTAATVLANARLDFLQAKREWENRLEEAQKDQNTVFDDYTGVFRRYLGITLSPEEVEQDPDALLDSWAADLASLFNPIYRFQDSGKGFVAEGPPRDDPATPWSELVIYAWLNLFGGPVVPTCEEGPVAPTTLCMRGEMDTAWEALQGEKEDLDTLESQAANALAGGKDAIVRAELSLQGVQETLASLEGPPDSLGVEEREKQLALALATLEEAEEALVELQGSVDPLEVEEREKQLALAQAILEEAEEALGELQEGTDPLEVEEKEKQLSLVQATLEEAEEALATIQEGPDPLEVARTEAEMASARQAQEVALQQLENATLRAPTDGIVSVVSVEAGEEVNARTPVIEVVDPTIIEMNGLVDEIDVLFVREEAPASVTLDALPGQELQGTVAAIALAARTQQGVVTYPVTIRLELPPDVELPEGLTAFASIVIWEERDVLVVPNQALYGSFEEPLVRVMRDGRVEEQPVVLGRSDDFWTAVREGLVEGDQVVMEVQEATTGQFGFGGGFRGGGGFPGGGGFRGGSTSGLDQRD